MTNSEAIKMLKSKMDGSVDTSYEWCECVRLAIKALEEQENPNSIRINFVGEEEVEEFKEYLKNQQLTVIPNQQPCADCISREEAIKYFFRPYTKKENYLNTDILKVLRELPPVTSQPKTGHWVKVTNGRDGHECDLCHEYAPSYQSGDEYLTKYCPNCGAKMVEPQESEVNEL